MTQERHFTHSMRMGQYGTDVLRRGDSILLIDSFQVSAWLLKAWIGSNCVKIEVLRGMCTLFGLLKTAHAWGMLTYTSQTMKVTFQWSLFVHHASDCPHKSLCCLQDFGSDAQGVPHPLWLLELHSITVMLQKVSSARKCALLLWHLTLSLSLLLQEGLLDQISHSKEFSVIYFIWHLVLGWGFAEFITVQ